MLRAAWPPDLTDPATVGALAEAVREAYGDPRAYASPTGPHGEWYVVYHRNRVPSFVGGATEAAAWLAAWNSRPLPPSEVPRD